MDLPLYLALIPALGVAAQWIAYRCGLPSILLLLGFGILLGRFVGPDNLIEQLLHSEPGTGSLLLLPIVSLSVAVILFEGGLSLKFRELGQAWNSVVRLCTIGAAITMIGTAVSAHWLLGLNGRLSWLLGGILTVTGPTVIGPLLRQIRPSRRVAAVLKWEGIVIDPIGAILAVLVFEYLILHTEALQISEIFGLMFRTIVIGSVIGMIAALAIAHALKKFLLPDHLQGIVTLAVALLGFAISNHIADESGLVAVTVMGMALVNRRDISIDHIIEFKEHLRTLLIGCLFIVLGSRLEPANVIALGWRGAAFVGLMIVVIRPLSVLIATAGTKLSYRERGLIAAMAPRGIVAAAVTSVFALRLETAGVDELTASQATQLVPITFAVIIGTVGFYGFASGWLARWLGLSQPNAQGLLIVGAEPWVRQLAELISQFEIAVVVLDTNYNKVATAKMEGLNAHCVNILSDHGLDHLDLAGIGRLLALTPNDVVNSMATQMHRAQFGSENVYQLATKNLGSGGQERSIATHLHGRILLDAKATHSFVRERIADGALFKSTTLSETFTIAQFRDKHGPEAMILMSIDDLGLVRIATSEKALEPVRGQRIIFLTRVVQPATSVPPSPAARR